MRAVVALGTLLALGACRSEDPAAAPAPGSAETELVLPMPRLTVGDRYTEELEDRSKFAGVSDDGVHRTYDAHDVLVATRTVLAVAAGEPTRFDVTYDRVREEMTIDTTADAVDHPIANHRYLITLAPDGLTATTPAGTPVFDHERTSIQEQDGLLANPLALEHVLSRKRFRVGVAVAFDAEDLATLARGIDFDTVDEYRVTAATFTLRRLDRAIAVFDAVMIKGGPNDPGAQVQSDLTGEVVADRVTGRVLSVRLDGAISGRSTGTYTLRTVIRQLPREAAP